MSKTLTQIAQELKDANKKVQLIYAFNGTGKTRLSKEFQKLINGPEDLDEETENKKRKILYYNAFTEDLFYWDNDLENDDAPKLKIQPNTFTNWILREQGQAGNIISNFQNYTNDKLTPKFSEDFSEVAFSFERGDDTNTKNIKISKGEESNFIWCVFYSFLEQIIENLDIVEENDRATDQFNNLEYVFIDDPVSSLDENHLIELGVDLAALIKTSKSSLKFIITTHNPLFYNVLYNEFRKEKSKKYILKKQEDGGLTLEGQENDSPFSYHLYLKRDLENAIQSGTIQKYHFNLLRNILEKTATFLGKDDWVELLPKMSDTNTTNPYEKRILNLRSHSKHSGDEVRFLTEEEKNMLTYLFGKINEIYNIKIHNDR